MLHKLATVCLILMLTPAMVLSLAQPAHAQPPGLPHQFYGKVTIGGNPAPSGTSIVAQIGGITYASTTVDSQGEYGYTPLFVIPTDNPDTPDKDGGVNGNTVQFFVGGTAAQTYAFASGSITKLALSVSGGGGGTPPPAPALSSPANGATGVGATPELDWNASSGATSYQIQVSAASDFSTTVFNQSGISDTQVTVSPALNGSTKYYWRVNASNSSGTSSWSSVRNFTTEAAATTPPSAPALSTPSNTATGVATTPTLQWSAPSGATSYQIQVSTAGDFGNIVFNQPGISTTQAYVSPALSGSTTYYWRVNASNSIGTSDWSSAWSFTTAAGGAAPPPTSPPTSPPTPPASSITINAAVLGHAGSFSISSGGVLGTSTTLGSADGAVQLSLKANTTVTIQGQSLTVTAEPSPPAPPADTAVIIAYKFSPSESTFNPTMTLTMKYDPSAFPAGVTESKLYIAYWDGSKWAALSSIIDTQAKIVTAQISHFSVYAILGTVGTAASPEPAKFAVSDLKITPASVSSGEAVTIAAAVTNSGGSQGSYPVVLKIKGTIEAEDEVTLDPGKTEVVTFTISKEGVGSYSVAIDGKSGSFKVTAPETGKTGGWSLPSIGILALGGLLIIILIVVMVRRRA